MIFGGRGTGAVSFTESSGKVASAGGFESRTSTRLETSGPPSRTEIISGNPTDFRLTTLPFVTTPAWRWPLCRKVTNFMEGPVYHPASKSFLKAFCYHLKSHTPQYRVDPKTIWRVNDLFVDGGRHAGDPPNIRFLHHHLPASRQNPSGARIEPRHWFSDAPSSDRVHGRCPPRMGCSPSQTPSLF